MRFGLVHRVLTNALAALGVLALLSGGQFSRSATIAILASLALAVARAPPYASLRILRGRQVVSPPQETSRDLVRPNLCVL